MYHCRLQINKMTSTGLRKSGASHVHLAPAAKSTTSSSTTSHMPLPGANSIMGILATRKIAKQFALKVAARRANRMGMFGYSSASVSRANQPVVQVEPTYRMGPQRVFNSDAANKVIQNIVENRMEGFKYSPKKGNMMSKLLTEEIKDKMKTLNYTRYKYVCMVSIGESKDQCMLASSQCCWDSAVDRYTSFSWHQNQVYCSANLFAVYHE